MTLHCQLPVSPPQNGVLHILLVEDDLLIQRVLGRLLDRAGHRYTLASNATEATAHLRSDAGAFDVAVVDCGLPEMSGVELAHRLRQMRPGLPLVLTSGNMAAPPVPGWLTQTGPVPFLLKPFQLHQLMAAVDEAIGAVARLHPSS